MKKIAKAFSGLIIIAALFVLGNSLVITYPDEYMIVRQFGEHTHNAKFSHPQTKGSQC